MLLRDLSLRTRLILTGPDRVRFLHSMLTNDIEALRPGMGCRSAMLTVKGKTVAELYVYADEAAHLVETDVETGARVSETFSRHLMMDDAEVEDVTAHTREQGVYGDDAAAELERVLGVDVAALPPYHFRMAGAVRVARAPELGMAGFHVFGDVALSGEPLDDAAWEVLRIEAGRPRYGADVDEDRLILEAGMDDAVSLSKGCYLGQEVVARATARGHINRKLVGLRISGDAPLSPGTRLSGPGRDDAGLVTSSVVSPRFGAIALGYVHRTLWEPGTQLVAPDGRAVQVAALPFRTS